MTRYLTRIFNDLDGNTLTPIARTYGQTLVSRSAEVSLQYLIFEPGTVFRTPPKRCHRAQAVAQMGGT